MINTGKQTNINARSAVTPDLVYEGTTPCKQLKAPPTIIPKSQTSQITGIFFLTLLPSSVGLEYLDKESMEEDPKERNDQGKHGKHGICYSPSELEPSRTADRASQTKL